MARRRPNGAGMDPVKRGDGRFAARVYVTQPDGTRKPKWVYAREYEECLRKRDDLLRREREHVPTPARDMTVGEWLDYWMEHIVQPNRSPRTYQEYAKRIRLYLRPELGSKGLLALQVRDVRAAIGKLGRTKGPSVADVSKRTLSAALGAAIAEDIGLTRNVAQPVSVKLPPPKRKRWTLDQVLAFLAEARGDRLYPLFLLVAVLGLRTNEAASLRWQDVDFEARVLHLERQAHGGEEGGLKTEASQAVLPLPRACIGPLRWQRMRQQAQREEAAAKGRAWRETGYVFTTGTGVRIWHSQIHEAFQALISRAGLPAGEIRTLRRSCASLLVHLNVAPRVTMAILRHSKIATTMEVYAEAPAEDVRDAVGQLDRLLRNHRR